MAIVGANGAGKTTLLEIITGEQEADAGTVARGKDLVIGYLRQEVAESPGRTVLAEVLAGAGTVSGIGRRMQHIEQEMAEAARSRPDELDELMDEYGRLQHRFEQLGGWSLEAEARRILAGLGFADADAERDIGEFSGGWMMRVALARLLLANPDLLLLDEPSNHLDLASVEWLQGFLAEYAGAVILVSHDRDFINAVVNRVAELSTTASSPSTSATSPTSSTSATSGSPQLEMQARVQGRKIARIERFIERFRYKKTKATPGPEPDQAGRSASSGSSRARPTGPSRSSSASRSRRAAAGWSSRSTGSSSATGRTPSTTASTWSWSAARRWRSSVRTGPARAPC